MGIGRVTIEKRKNSLRLRLGFNNKDYSLTIQGGITQTSLDVAKVKAERINSDLALDKFDSTLEAYQNQSRSQSMNEPQQTLIDAWENYKRIKKNQIAITSQEKLWKEEEVTAILEAFQLDTYNPPKSAFKQSYYYPYTAFLAFTSCRPEEAVAMTGDDLIWTARGCKANINKAYSKGILLDTTKNNEARTIGLSSSLADILAPLPGRKTNGLLFPNRRGDYLDRDNYRSRQ